MDLHRSVDNRRALLDAKLTELGLYAKALCPEARVEMSTSQVEDEDAHVDLFPPAGLSEEDEERVELALAARAGDIFEETGLFILCALLDHPLALGGVNQNQRAE
jgi:hypothetical protein